MTNQNDDGLIAIATGFILAVVVTAVVVGIGMFSHGYASGQADAIRGQWWTQLVYHPDGSSETVNLDHPTTRPMTAWPLK